MNDHPPAPRRGTTDDRTRAQPSAIADDPLGVDLPDAPAGDSAKPAATSARGMRLGGTAWTPRAPAATPEPAATATVPTTASVPTVGRTARRRRRRRWYRRPAILGPLALLLVAIGGATALLLRAEATVATLQDTTAPGPTVSGEALGGDPSLVVDTAPALAFLRERGAAPPDDDGLLGRFQDAAGNVGGLAQGAAVAAGVVDPSRDAFTVLVLGVDARPGQPIDFAIRPDALMVLRLDPRVGICRVLAIPRDTRTELPGYGLSKLNHALAVGGIPYQREVVEDLLGIAIDRYALVDFVGYQELVDALGGIEVTVPEAFVGEGVSFAAGPQTLDGGEALAYVRYRDSALADNDARRVQRQQQVIRALARAAVRRDAVRDVDALLPALEDHVRTDLSIDEVIGLADQYRAACAEDRIAFASLQGTATMLEDDLLRERLSYVVIDPAEIRRKVAELLAP